MIPVPGVGIGTPYGKRGSYWSCNEDSHGNGIHTGVDYPTAKGTKIVAARPGTLRYCNHGSAFGNHQFEIMPGDGTRDFYAHASKRSVADGTKVQAGQKVGEVGAEGNVTGPHLHFERHKVASGSWSCGIIVDPKPSINYSEDDMPLSDDDLSAIAKRVNQVIGDFLAKGEPREGYGGKGEPAPEQGDTRIRQIENVVRDIQTRVKNIEKKV